MLARWLQKVGRVQLTAGSLQPNQTKLHFDASTTGANIASFTKVAEAVLAQGAV